MTPAADAVGERTLRGHLRTCLRIVQKRQARAQICFIAGFDTEGALCYCADTYFIGQELRYVIVAPDAPEPGSRQNQRIEFPVLEFFEPRIDIPAHRRNLQIRAIREQLCASAQTSRTDPGILRQVRKLSVASADQHVTGIFSLWHSDKRQAGWQLGRQILQRMNRQVNFAGDQSIFDFFSENSLAANLFDSRIDEAVAAGSDRAKLDLNLRHMLFNLPFHPARLSQGQRAAARADSESNHGFSRLNSFFKAAT